MTKVIGLTGGIASGKSTVAKLFMEKNIPIIDADVIAKEVVEPGTPAYDQVIKEFGVTILHDDLSIDRKLLGSIVFTDDVSRGKLNEIVHPFVKKKMLEQRNVYIEAKEKVIVLDIPLLFESNLTGLVDEVWVVFVDQTTQLGRLMKRNQLSEEEAMSRIKSQMPIDKKARNADVIINNSGLIEETKSQFESCISQFL